MPRKVVRPYVDQFAAVSEAQSGVLSRSQLGALGWTQAHIERSIRAGRWARYGDQAVAVHRGPLSTRQQRWIAVVNGGPAATLASLTAAEEWGLVGFETQTIHIVVPRGDWVPRRQAGVKVHISRRFTIDDRHPVRMPPIVSVDRAVVDAAVWSRLPRRASVLVIAAVQQGLTRPDRLRDELLRAGRVRHRRLVAAVLDDVEGGVRALSELDFARLCRRHRLPTPVLQVSAATPTGGCAI